MAPQGQPGVLTPPCVSPLGAGPAQPLCPALPPGLAGHKQRPAAGEGRGALCAARADGQRLLLEQGHHSSLFHTSLWSYFFRYNERGKNTFVISRWGETIAVLTPPPAGAESPSQGEFASPACCCAPPSP